MADLTGQPYLPTDRASADALAAVPGIRLALADYGPDDVPDWTGGLTAVYGSWTACATDSASPGVDDQ